VPGIVRRRAAFAAAVALAAAVPSADARAQDSLASRPAPATAWLPLDDAAYRYVDALMARGALPGLSALERPYTVGELRRALAASDTSDRGATVRGWARALDGALRRLDARPADDSGDAPALRLSLLVGGTAESSGQRELTRADGVSGAHPVAGARGVLAMGPAVAVVRILLDQRLDDDPDFRGSKLRSVTGRTEDAYVAAQWRYGSLFFGRQARSWGPWAVEGLQLGNAAYSWDHVAATLGTGRLHLTSVVARLDPYVAGADSGRYERHLALHRLQARVGPVEIGVAEGVTYGGVGRGTELAYANPLGLYQLAQYNETGDGNVSYAADVAWRVRRLGTLAAQLLVDDLQVDRCATTCQEPASLGWTLSAEGLPLAGDQRAFASYTRVGNLTYRSPQPWERWTSFDVGLGRAASDYDEARAGVDLALFAAAPVRAYAAYRRQGEGDYALPFPAPADYARTPGFLAGLPERTWRVAVSGGYASRLLELSGDVGVNRVTDAGHVAGRTRTGLEGRLRATLHLLSPVVRP
jgi:hypothetical protein